jgi:hypothetical protein
MLANEDRLRASVRIGRTARDMGWQTMVKLSIYDNGIVGVDDLPLNPIFGRCSGEYVTGCLAHSRGGGSS